MAKQKIVHLHLKDPTAKDTDFFFGSIKAIFDNVSEDCIGIKYKSLTNALRGQDFYENKRCTVRIGQLITRQQSKKDDNNR